MTAGLADRVSASKERRFWGGLILIVAVVAATGFWYLNRSDESNHKHGNPDPGGRRFAALQAFAPQTVPSNATGVRAQVHGYRWDPQTCDGDAPGWASADVDMTFHAPSNAPTSLDAQMRQLKWRQVPVDHPSSGPSPASPGPGSRVYEPDGANPDGESASLTPPDVYGDGLWDLDISAAPAEVPSHDC